jgi:hypothetical protein
MVAHTLEMLVSVDDYVTVARRPDSSEMLYFAFVN